MVHMHAYIAWQMIVNFMSLAGEDSEVALVHIGTTLMGMRVKIEIVLSE